MNKLTWKAKISKSGDRFFIIIPKALHEMIQPLKNRQITVIILSEEQLDQH
ncbi:MAG: hypothetical protein QXT28_07060 [Thermofilaceae archaeon]